MKRILLALLILFWADGAMCLRNIDVGTNISSWVSTKTIVGLWVIMKSNDVKTSKMLSDLFENMDEEYLPEIGIEITVCGHLPISIHKKMSSLTIIMDPTCRTAKEIGVLVFPTFIVRKQSYVVSIHPSLTLMTSKNIEEDLSALLNVPYVMKRPDLLYYSLDRQRSKAHVLLDEAKRILEQDKDRNNAQIRLLQALKIFPNCPSCELLLGIISLEQGDLVDSKTRFQKVLDLDSTHPQALLGLSLAYIQSGHYRLALHILQTSKALGGYSAWVSYGMGEICKHLEKDSSCKEYRNMRYSKPPSYQGLWQ